jgi:hypothetical protein
LFYGQVFESDLLTSKIQEYAALVAAYNAEHHLVDQAEYDAAVDTTLAFVAQRHQFLSTTELLGE